MRIRCDEPMARRKGILQYCDRNCERCIAGIRMEDSGIEAHCNPKNDPKIRERNIRVLSGEEPDRQRKKWHPRTKGGGIW